MNMCYRERKSNVWTLIHRVRKQSIDNRVNRFASTLEIPF